MPLEELFEINLYSASKRPEKLTKTPAAAFVLTAADISRAGVTSIPEALRLVPGVQVAQINSNNWAISIRGFNREFSNKLLVLIDGRAVYTPLFSGVFWNDLDYVLDEIEKIEVIRGPGGTLWGANAVNGVINIITKEARKSVGNYVSFTTGTNENAIVEFRNGVNTKQYDYLRTYGKFKKINEFKTAGVDKSSEDEWNRGQAGFRYDFRDRDYDKATIQGDYYYGRRGFAMQTPTDVSPFFQNEDFSEDSTGGNIMFKWNKPIGNLKSDITGYIDYQYRDSNPIIVQEQTTYNLDYQGNYDIKKHSFTGGFGYRLVTDNLNNTRLISYSPESTSFSIYNAFIQDKIDLYNNKLFFTLGSKIEYNDYTGSNFQPNARLLYQISDKQSVWAAVSKAVRTPSRGIDSFQAYAIEGQPYNDAFLIANKYQDTEKLNSYEIGYRADITKDIYIDTTAFYNKYEDLEAYETISGPSPYISIASNNGSADNFGVEAYVYAAINQKWDIRGGVTMLAVSHHIDPFSNDFSVEQDEDRSPKYQFTITSYNKFTDKLSWSNSLYYSSNIAYYDASFQRNVIDAYARVDSVLTYKVSRDLEFSLFGRNLTDDYHQEFNELIYAAASEIPRTFGITAKYKF
ncbi:MAG TPA: hypothetical protein DIV86_02540 [Alphaproteobacteria bacterium]|nr:hypothetical protein [Alphaproteobacteria bacterium]